jgi:hypothetical protein
MLSWMASSLGRACVRFDIGLDVSFSLNRCVDGRVSIRVWILYSSSVCRGMLLDFSQDVWRFFRWFRKKIAVRQHLGEARHLCLKWCICTESLSSNGGKGQHHTMSVDRGGYLMRERRRCDEKLRDSISLSGSPTDWEKESQGSISGDRLFVWHINLHYDIIASNLSMLRRERYSTW